MLDPNRIREHPEELRKTLAKRGMAASLADDFFEVDGQWRTALVMLETGRAKLNQLSRERNIEEAKRVKMSLGEQEENAKVLAQKRDELLVQFPNIPAEDVPVGKDETANVVVRTWPKGAPKKGGKEYLEIATSLGLIDVERAGKVAGSRFGYLLREAALLEFALVRYAFDVLTKEGFIPVVPPVMVKPEHLIGMGKKKFIDYHDAFFLAEDNLYLAGTSEHTIGAMHADETFAETDLPRRYAGFSTCFRREAGSYGKDTKGILRVHQFDKVEMFSLVAPEQSEAEHQLMLSLQEKLMQALKLPYQVVANATGDMGFGDYKQFDIETWLPGTGKYRETQSCSNTTDYQARGLKIRYKPAIGDLRSGSRFVHTLNGTAFAIGRILIAIIENYQQADGSVKVPEVLVPYSGFSEIRPRLTEHS